MLLNVVVHRHRLLVDIARELGFSKLLLAHSATRLAVRMLADITQGRGAHLAYQMVSFWHLTLAVGYVMIYYYPYAADFIVQLCVTATSFKRILQIISRPNASKTGLRFIRMKRFDAV